MPPVLLIGFNRPELIRRQIESLRAVRPPRLFAAVDGPRPEHSDDARLRGEVISALDLVDWPCEVFLRSPDANRGLPWAAVEAIDWFFEHVEAGVILEDDCLARPEFFRFAGELLGSHRDDEEVMHISGASMLRNPNHHSSYVRAPLGHIWGWATWRRAWTHMDPKLSEWERHRDSIRKSGPLGRALARKFDSSRAGRHVRWPGWWYYSMVVRGGVALVPTVNLVENVGFGPGATHLKGKRHPLSRPADLELAFPIRHPIDQSIDEHYEELLAAYHARGLRDRTGDRLAASKRWLVERFERCRRNKSEVS